MDVCIKDPKERAQALAQKIRHALLTECGCSAEDASAEEFSAMFCLILREEILANWNASLRSMEEYKTRRLYLLSMEYLPGKFLPVQRAYLKEQELIQSVLKILNRHYDEVLDYEHEPGLGNGGLGRLSSCYLDSLASLQYPAYGYGLRYHYGIFEQEIWAGMQIERPDCWLLYNNPWERRRDQDALVVNYAGQMIDGKNQAEEPVELLQNQESVRALPYDTPILGYPNSQDFFSVVTMRLWSTKESPRNFLLQRYNAGFLEQAAENTSLTDVLYPNDNTEMGKRVRLKQEFLLASASIQDILRRHIATFGVINELGDKVRIQINDTHPTFAIVELIRLLLQRYNCTFQKAWEMTCQCCSFTNHTLLRESLEEWNEDRVASLLPRQYRLIQRIERECLGFASPEQKGEFSLFANGQIRMAHLAILGSHKVNGVSKLHSNLIREQLFPGWAKIFPDRFTNVTNGVSHRRWLLCANPLLADFLTQRIGPEWIRDFSKVAHLKELADDLSAQEAILQIKRQNKERLANFLMRNHFVRDEKGNPLSHPHEYNIDALFDMQIKRIHEYKRQLLLAVYLIMIYFEYKETNRARSVPRIFFFAGKAAPGYVKAKHILTLLCALSRQFREEHLTPFLQIVVVENYNVTKAEVLIPAADISEQISAAGWEASGTGNMKLSMNGALTIGTEDGATIEMKDSVGAEFWPFSFGCSAKEVAEPYNPVDIYTKDEKLRQALDTLHTDVFARSDAEKQAFQELYQDLISVDHYRILKDFRSYYAAQQKIDELYQKPKEWARMVLKNIGGMGPFSSDVAIQRYAKEIWQLDPCQVDDQLFRRFFDEFCSVYH